MHTEISEVRDTLGQHYNGNVANITKLPQTKNDGFHVSYLDGSERFVRVGPSFNQEKTNAQITIAGMLSEEGVAVPGVISTANGGNYVPFADGRVLEMHEWVPNGRPYESTLKDIGEVAEAMAGMHSAADRLDKTNSAVQLLTSQPYTGMQPGAKLPDEELIGYFTSRLNDIPGRLRPFVARDLPLMKEAIVTEIPGKDWGIIHADLHGEQTLFDKDTGDFKALIDWEWMLHGPRARDLAFSLYRLTEPTSDLVSPEPIVLATKFIEAYTNARPEFPEEDLGAASEHLEWDATCRRTRWLNGVLKQVDDGKVNEDRIDQLTEWFDSYSLERARDFRETFS